MWVGGGTHRIRQNEDAVGAQVDVVSGEGGLIERSEPVENGSRGTQLYCGVAEVERSVVKTVSCNDVHVAARVRCRASAALPDAALVAARAGIGERFRKDLG